MKKILFFLKVGLLFFLGTQSSCAQQLLDSTESEKYLLLQNALNYREMYVFIDVSKDTLLDMHLLKNDLVKYDQIFLSPFGTKIIPMDTNDYRAFATSNLEITNIEKSVNSNIFKIEIRFYVYKHLATINYFTYEFLPIEKKWIVRKYRKVQT